MYCPKCLNDSLLVSPKGVITLILNGKQMNNGRFLYNIERDDFSEFNRALREKIDEFFKWYENFQNRDPIHTVEVCSSDFVCSNGCAIGVHETFSVVDLLISYKDLVKMIKEEADKFGVGVELKDYH